MADKIWEYLLYDPVVTQVTSQTGRPDNGTDAASFNVYLSTIRGEQCAGLSETHAIRDGGMEELRPIMMACMVAALGLFPAAVSHGIGAQAQQPLARVIVGAMFTTMIAVLFTLPALETEIMDRRSRIQSTSALESFEPVEIRN